MQQEVDEKLVDELKELKQDVKAAKTARAAGNYPKVLQLHNVWLGKKSQVNIEDLLNKHNEQKKSRNDTEPVIFSKASLEEKIIVGLLGLLRTAFVTAIEVLAVLQQSGQPETNLELKNRDHIKDTEDLEQIKDQYDKTFNKLISATDLPFTIDDEAISWVGKYHQDLVLYALVTKQFDLAAEYLDEAIDSLDNRLKFAGVEYPELSHASKIEMNSVLADLYFQRANLQTSIADLFTGKKHFERSNPSVEEKKEMGTKIVTKTFQNRGKVSLGYFMRAVLLGATLYSQNFDALINL
jgi:tetratricopeptide (TPR) repeat protein